MKLLIIESYDQDKYGIDTSIMVVPNAYDEETALAESGLEKPTIVYEIGLPPEPLLGPLLALGEYRSFIG